MPSSFSRTATDTLLGGDTGTRTLVTGSPIVYAPADNTTVASGWNLLLPEPLIYAAAEQETIASGWFVFVDSPLDEPMTADVWLLDDFIADPTTPPTVTLDLVTDPDDDRSERAWDWQDVPSETGAGSITMAFNDPDIAALDVDDVLAVGFNLYGSRVFLMVTEDDDGIELSDDDEVGETLTIKGRGTGVLMEEGDVDPTGGPYRSPIEEDRHYGWVAESYSHDVWATVGVIGTVQNVIDTGALLLAGGFNEQFPVYIEQMTENVLRNLPTTTTPLLWTAGAGILNSPPGDAYFYEDSTMNPDMVITAAGDYVLHFIADDEGEFFCNGQNVGSVQGLNWLGSTSVSVTLSAGPFSVAAHVRNLDFGDNSQNGAYFGWVLASESSLTTVLGTQESVTVIAQSSGNAKILAYPPQVPGQAITKTIRLIVEESQSRGFMTGITLGFTDTTFSDGTACPAIPDYAVKVGQSVLGVLIDMAQTYIEWELDPVTLTLNVWAKGTTRPSNAVFTACDDSGEPESGNIVSYRRKRERRKYRRLLVKSPLGWSVVTGSGTTGGEAPLELGSAQSEDEIQRLGAGEIARFNNPRMQIDVGLVPENADDAPYLGWRTRSVVDDQWGGNFEGVAALTVATNSENPEDPIITASLRDLILSAEQRQANDLKSLL